MTLWGIQKKRLKISLVSGWGLFKWATPSRTVKHSGVNVCFAHRKRRWVSFSHWRRNRRNPPGIPFYSVVSFGLTSKSPHLVWLNNKFKGALTSSEKKMRKSLMYLFVSVHPYPSWRYFFCSSAGVEHQSTTAKPLDPSWLRQWLKYGTPFSTDQRAPKQKYRKPYSCPNGRVRIINTWSRTHHDTVMVFMSEFWKPTTNLVKAPICHKCRMP